ncbi:MAG: 50S ribosomal protein L33 [Candidatus Sericytochromatia bacterium]|nr:50S ribosomal protein L33 [Candidatus Sericytochromatia bacterium]
MAKGDRVIVKMRNADTGTVYTTMKNKRNNPERLELKKYDRKLKQHVVFKETK